MLYPVMDKHHDQEAKEQFERHFPKHKNCMRGIKMPKIIEEGGGALYKLGALGPISQPVAGESQPL